MCSRLAKHGNLHDVVIECPFLALSGRISNVG
jgi:hypothetical protein